MLLAIERARTLDRTALLVDPSEDKLVDTYYAYQSVQVVEAKRLTLDEVQGVRSRERILEDLRVQLVSAMRFGQTLYIRLADGACDFVNSCAPCTRTAPRRAPAATRRRGGRHVGRALPTVAL